MRITGVGIGVGVGLAPPSEAEGVVTPPSPSLSSFTLDPSSVLTGETSVGTITLLDAAGDPIVGVVPAVFASPSLGVVLGTPSATNGAGESTVSIVCANAGDRTMSASYAGVTLDDEPVLTVTGGTNTRLFLESLFVPGLFVPGLFVGDE